MEVMCGANGRESGRREGGPSEKDNGTPAGIKRLSSISNQMVYTTTARRSLILCFDCWICFSSP